MSEPIGKLALGIAVIALGVAIVASQAGRRGPTARPQTPAKTDWLAAAPAERAAQLEKHLRGLDVAMAEIGYRFSELYFAGRDANWDYAKYQAEKMDLALRLAIERRPKRAKSSQPFLNEDLPAVQEAIAVRDRLSFERAMGRLRTACMKCHTDENVPYFIVELPERRISSIRNAP